MKDPNPPAPITLPHPGKVRIPIEHEPLGYAPCVIEKETNKSYWVRWTKTLPFTRIREGEIMPVLKKHVTFDEAES